ncbi:hypothetical protein CEW92_00010 [Bacillaceae bacterium SAS-127]|nr:hypothetical protein CEW92_00010 [Bacillaceae bacterium SAS-127]
MITSTTFLKLLKNEGKMFLKEKFSLIFFISITFFIAIVSSVSATSPFVIGEGKAGGYQYTIIKEQDTFTWKIGHQEKISTIIENPDIEETLEHFRMAVNDIDMQIFKMIISVIYILIVVITTLILYKKNKQMLKSGGAIIAISVGVGLYMMLVTSIDLNATFQDAKFYYLLLMN